MARKAKKVNYVQLEPAAFLSDDDFQMMNDAERGIYCTVIFYMFCNNGRIKNDHKAIKRLCNVTSNFEQKWEGVMSKLYQKGVWLRHRRVDLELNKAKTKLHLSVEAGLKGADKRWGGHKGSHRKPIAKGREGKGNIKKDRLFPISGKNCSCGMPAVYKDSSGEYDNYYCADCMPEKVKARYR